MQWAPPAAAIVIAAVLVAALAPGSLAAADAQQAQPAAGLEATEPEPDGPTSEAEPRGDEPLAPVGPSGLAPPPSDLETTAQAPCSAGHIALTFDDGPGHGTPVVLNALRDNDVAATFFMIGSAAAASPSLVARAQRKGHRVANHTFNHERLTLLSNSAIRSTVDHAHTTLRNAGARPLRLVRPPYGLTNSRVRLVLEGAGYGQVLWSIDTYDWQGPTAQQIVSRVLHQLHPGAIVLMHDGSPYASRSAAALPHIVAGARARGYCFGLLDESGRVVPHRPEQVAPPVGVASIAGQDRVGTAVAIAQAGWSSSSAALLARADHFADALSASGLAGTLDAPLLITPRDRLDGRVAAELDRLGAHDVYVVGGLDDAVAWDVRARGMRVETLRGADRFATSTSVAAAAIEVGAQTSTAYVATGHDFPDALTIGALAAANHHPLLLSHRDDRARLQGLIDRWAIDHVVVAGGPAALPDEVFAGLSSVSRLAGRDRFATALVIAEHAAAEGRWHPAAYLASGQDFPDALTGAPLAGRHRRPLLVTGRDVLSPRVHQWVVDHQPDHLTVLGGRAAVGDGPRCQLRTGLDQPTAC